MTNKLNAGILNRIRFECLIKSLFMLVFVIYSEIEIFLLLKVIRSYHGHLSGVYCLALHPNIDILLTGGRDSVCRV